MWFEVFRFEMAYHLRQRLVYISTLVFVTLAVLMTSTRLGLTLENPPPTAEVNAPIMIARMLTILALLGMFVITAFVASSGLRDFERNTHMLFFSF